MNFEEYKNIYFGGNEDDAMKAFVCEVTQKNYKYSRNENEWKIIASGLTTEQRRKYSDYLIKDIKRKSEETRIKKASKYGIKIDEDGHFILTVSSIKRMYKSFHRLESVLGWFAIVLGVLLIWYFDLFDDFKDFRNYVGILFCFAHILVGFLIVFPKIRFMRAFTKGNFCIEKQKVTQKQVSKGDSESSAVYTLVFDDGRKFRWNEAHSDYDLHEVEKDDLCYIITFNRKINFVFDSKKYKISKDEFEYDGSIYKMKKR